MKPRTRSVAALLAGVALAATLLACASDESTGGARAVTTEESQQLAIARFASFDLGSRAFTAEVTEQGSALHLTGWIDYGSQLGYAAVTGDFPSQALLWTETTVGIIEQEPAADGTPQLPIPALDDPGWQSIAIDTSSSTLQALLAIVSSLGSDRPDNPLLVQQSGALWLREDTVGETPVTVYATPLSDEPITDGELPSADDSPLRLWLDASGLILRAEARLGTEWTTIDFPDGEAPSLELPEEGE